MRPVDPILYPSNLKEFDFDNFYFDIDRENPYNEDYVMYPAKPEWRDDFDARPNRKLKAVTRNRYQQSLLKNITTKELKNVYEMAPPMPGMSMGGPLYQEGLEQWQRNTSQGGYKRKNKTKKKVRKSKRKN